ncbi:MAG: hypothetical protein R3F14_36520 [Polyangiaceae bacterium]
MLVLSVYAAWKVYDAFEEEEQQDQQAHGHQGDDDDQVTGMAHQQDDGGPGGDDVGGQAHDAAGVEAANGDVNAGGAGDAAGDDGAALDAGGDAEDDANGAPDDDVGERQFLDDDIFEHLSDIEIQGLGPAASARELLARRRLALVKQIGSPGAKKRFGVIP